MLLAYVYACQMNIHNLIPTMNIPNNFKTGSKAEILNPCSIKLSNGCSLKAHTFSILKTETLRMVYIEKVKFLQVSEVWHTRSQKGNLFYHYSIIVFAFHC